MNVPTPAPTVSESPALPSLPPVLDGPVRRCLHCDAFTLTGFHNTALRCPVCGHATTPIPADVQAAALKEMLKRMAGGQDTPLVQVALNSTLEMWEARAQQRGEATVWPKGSEQRAVHRAPGRAIGPPPKLLPRTGHLPLEERFWSRVDKSGDCWIWTAGTAKGRGWFEATRAEGGKKAFAYRWAWELTRGPIPKGLQLFNECGNRLCVRPEHYRIAKPRPPRKRKRGESAE